MGEEKIEADVPHPLVLRSPRRAPDAEILAEAAGLENHVRYKAEEADADENLEVHVVNEYTDEHIGTRPHDKVVEPHSRERVLQEQFPRCAYRLDPQENRPVLIRARQQITERLEPVDVELGIDFEAEVAVVTDDVPMAVSAGEALQYIRLVMLVNDVSLRKLIPGELAKGFGFFQSKPSSAFSPVCVTPDTLGDAWHDGKLHLPLRSIYNGDLFGMPNAGVDMTFNFAELIAHAAKTRPLAAGCIVGSGTVSNKLDNDWGRPVAEGGAGYSCIAEIRMIETIEHGAAKTDFMKFGDSIRIEMLDQHDNSIFGAIDQRVEMG